MLLAVSFGTSYEESRKKAIGGVEEALQEAFPDERLCRAFTSRMIAKKLQKEGLEILSEAEALEKAARDGETSVILQPTHIIPGFEYDLVAEEAEKQKEKFSSLKLGAPLFYDEKSYDELLPALLSHIEAERGEGRAVIFMGHGSEHEANEVYEAIGTWFDANGAKDVLVATVEGTPTLEDLMPRLKALGVKDVTLRPLMLVAGDHAHNDMDGEWREALEAEGFTVHSVFEGLGELPFVQEAFVRRAKAARAL